MTSPLTPTDDVNWYIDKRLVHSVHTSERYSYRACPRRHDWIFNEGYYPRVTPKPLEFGAAFHAGMEALYDPMTWHDKEAALALALMRFKETCEEQYHNYLRLNEGIVDADAKADYEERIQLGLGMLKYYGRHVIPVADSNFTPVKVEIEFEVPIKNPDDGKLLWCKCKRCWKRFQDFVLTKHDGTFVNTLDAVVDLNRDSHLRSHGDIYWYGWRGLPVTYGGRIDAIITDGLDRYWIVDWKTAMRLSGTPRDDSFYANDDFMQLDDQITSYCWALWTLHIPVVGFIYAQIKKAVPQEPEPNKTRRLGRLYSVNKQQDTTYELYKATVEENDPEAYVGGLYDDFLAYLKSAHGPRFHIRHQIFRSEAELRNAGRNIWLEAKEIVDSEREAYPTPGRFSCNGCAFQDPCLAKNRDEDYQYALDTLFEKRDRLYWEREPASTDKRSS